MQQMQPITAKTASIPVLDMFPTAFFVTGELGDGVGTAVQRGLRKSSKEMWRGVTMTAEELSVIIPISKSLISDAAAQGFDLFAMVQPRLEEAFAAKFDAAVLHGLGKPTTWPLGIVDQAIAAGHSVALGTGADMYDDIFGESGLMSLVENDDFDINGNVGALSMKSKLRGLRATTGQPLEGEPMFWSESGGQDDENPGLPAQRNYILDGTPLNFSKNKGLNKAIALLVSGDWQQAVWSYRQELEYTLSDSAVMNDASGVITMNAYQQNAVFMKATMRLAWALPNPITLENDTTQFPFAVLTA
jgi:hypothetical protein